MAGKAGGMMHTGSRHTKHDVETGALANLSTPKDCDVLQGVFAAAEPPADNVAQQPVGEEKESAQGHDLIALANEAARYWLCITAGQQSGALVALGERLEVRDNGLKQCLLHGT
jgi:hypothetical protein